ncbi:dolichyl pyrophosphate Man9GlcNAc2 alpha-1,3-glucosyltransferase-like isoform X2 [Oppia nitens]|uniref:dolichyl pyrophosphate Man9GlcNAc2 alpha-1,3-glucosyltransferase-like isoform X2 n=1 Tax=Oppia nitens TaxID=1686743 RepID=UPI0023DBF652|nr:dolichyl pyrophosphate Man9GlcNAc2 alpha-1,3-glucosyltransferase-like isoform X2 [Oppia nitens]
MLDNVWYFGNLLAVLLRWMTGQHSYSGESSPPMFGDYEAQRHWMEVTVNLETNQWYTNSTDNDLLYWGLDYPPLTAYHSYLNGKIAQYLNPLWVELHTSRGFESYYHKIFMRSTVLAVDLLIYFTAVYNYWSIYMKGMVPEVKPRDKAVNCVISLLNPALILIDYGHFQYNCVSLGLVIWTLNCLMSGYHITAAIVFSLALNYKQMSLYYAFPIFWYLLSICFSQRNKLKQLIKLVSISMAVIFTFVILWLPYIHSIESIFQLLNRIFPFNRGIYEDKVSNFWFSLSILIKIKNFFTDSSLAKMSLLTTVVALMPSSYAVFKKPTIDNLKYSLINSSLIFFLFSFQVHEKSILMVSICVLLLMDKHPLCCLWFVVISTFSLQPLLIKDSLMIPYFSLIIFFICVYTNAFGDFDIWHPICWRERTVMITFISSMVGCLLLSIGALTIPAPKRLPDIHAFEVYKMPNTYHKTTVLSSAKKRKQI